MNTLSVFVDESGDFGKYESHSPFYIFTLVFHEQSSTITNQINILEQQLINLSLKPNHCFHSGPIIRREDDYRLFTIQKRRNILNKLITFTKKVDLQYVSFFADKKEASDSITLTATLSKQLFFFLQSNLSYFSRYDKIILYYDNGQHELGRLLAATLSILSNVEYRKVQPANYRLFQVADLLCTLELLSIKASRNMLSVSELSFFSDKQTLFKNYIKPARKKRFVFLDK